MVPVRIVAAAALALGFIGHAQAGFTPPPRILPLAGVGISPRERAALAPAVATDLARQPGLVSHASAARADAYGIRLGALGWAVVVEAHAGCGNGGCPFVHVYLPRLGGYRLVAAGDGFGPAVVPSGGPVPDLVFGWGEGGSEANYDRWHYAHGTFAVNACEIVVRTHVAACKPGGVTFALPAPTAFNFGVGGGISVADYGGLKSRFERDLAATLPAGESRPAFADTHAAILPGIGLVAEAGNCRRGANCPILAYRETWPGPPRPFPPPAFTRLLLSGASGWGVAVTTATDAAGATAPALVVASSIPGQAASTVMLTRYRFAGLPPPANGVWLHMRERLLPDACRIIRPGMPDAPCAPGIAPVRPAVDATPVGAALQDATGSVWAPSVGWGGLLRWSDAGWRHASDRFTGARFGSTIARVWPGPAGGVIEVETQTGPRQTLIWRRGGNARLLARAEALDLPVVAAARHGVLVASYTQARMLPRLNRIDAARRLRPVYSFRRSQFSPPSGPASYKLRATVDLGGTAWFWSPWYPPQPSRSGQLRGLLQSGGRRFIYHAAIHGLPAPLHLAAVQVWDRRHLAIALAGGGLYLLNTRSLRARALPPPRAGAFRQVQLVLAAEGDHFVLTQGARGGSLWRLHGDRWSELLAHSFFSGGWADTPQGLFLGVALGLRFIPASGGAPRFFNWRERLPMASVGQIFSMPGRRLLVLGGARRRAVQVAIASLLRPPAKPVGLSMLLPSRPLAADARGRVWGMLTPHALAEWDGAAWTSHSLPAGVAPAHILGLDADTRGRIWLFPDCTMGPAARFNPAARRWTVFRDYRLALSGQPRPVRFLHASQDQEAPIYGPHGRQIAFVGPCWGVNYFDGAQWRLWNGGHLPGGPQASLMAPPFFDPGGHLALDLDNIPGSRPQTWQYRWPGGWRRRSYIPRSGAVMVGLNWTRRGGLPPAGCNTPAPDSVVADGAGRRWWTAQGTLYVGTTGHCRAVLSAAAPQPFLDGRRLVQALVDARGNVFLRTAAPFSTVVLPAGSIPGASALTRAPH